MSRFRVGSQQSRSVLSSTVLSVPEPDGSFDFAVSEYGASIWADHYVWIPEVHRLLKPGGEHLIAVRVDSEVAAGGIWRPVSLISTDSEATPVLLRDILRERRMLY